MPAPFQRLGAMLSRSAQNSGLGLNPVTQSVLAQQLLAQSMQGPQGLVSPSGVLNKALQGLLARQQTIANQEQQQTQGARQQGLAGALSRAGSADPARAEAARRASLIIAGGMPDNPLAQSLLGQQAKNVMAPGGDESFTLSPGQTRYSGSGKEIVSAPASPDGGKPIPDLVNEISDDLYKESQTFAVQLANIGNVRQSIGDASPAGDMGLVYAYMKMLDPTSAVREAEYATAENARGVPASVRNIWNRLQNGQRLDEDQRKDFSSRAERYFAQERANQERRNQRFLSRATGAGIPAEMFSQYLLPLDPAQASQGAAPAATTAPPAASTASGQPQRRIP
jgi:hypothetical protein